MVFSDLFCCSGRRSSELDQRGRGSIRRGVQHNYHATSAFEAPPDTHSSVLVGSSASPENLVNTSVVWVSVDPRDGEVSIYPSAASMRLEQARRIGEPTTVSLTGLGDFFEGAVVNIDMSGSANTAQQRTLRGGRRDVLRIELPVDADSVVVHVAHEGFWRLVEAPVLGVTCPRFASVSTGEMLTLDSSNGSLSYGDSAISVGKGCESYSEGMGKFWELTPEERAARDIAVKEALKAAGALGLVGVWEWCRDAAVADPSMLPPEMWGVYSEEQNGQIEAAFLALEPSVSVCIGIRSFVITFEGTTGGRQVDCVFKKRRYVRRRLVTIEDQRAILREASHSGVANLSHEVADLECAICCISFTDSPTMAFVKLPSCGHFFHVVCSRLLAHINSPCPLCREEVDWRGVLHD